MNNRRSQYWVFTLNNPDRDDGPRTWPDVQYCVWQKERGAEGTEHLQGYVVFVKNKQLSWLKKNCGTQVHWEPRKGTHEQARDYCQKEESRVAGPWTTGDEGELSGGQGKRNDLLLLKRKLDEGATEQEIAVADDTFPIWAKYHRVLQRYKMLKRSNERDWPTYTQVYWGEPGTGKTRRALEEAGPGAYWLPRPEANGMVWWDGYDGHEIVVIDEFYGWIRRDLMQRMCDRYPLLVQTKNGTTPFLAKKIIITSNEHPVAWWHKIGLGAMQRRLEGTLGNITQVTVAGEVARLRGVQPALIADEVLAESVPVTPRVGGPNDSEYADEDGYLLVRSAGQMLAAQAQQEIDDAILRAAEMEYYETEAEELLFGCEFDA